MRDTPDTAGPCAKGFDGTIRHCWNALLIETLPSAARGRRWPVTTAAGFERILLDHVLGCPWEQVIAPPTGQNADALDLLLAIELGGQIVDGTSCVAEINRHSLALRAASVQMRDRDCDPRCRPQDDAAELLRHLTPAARARRFASR